MSRFRFALVAAALVCAAPVLAHPPNHSASSVASATNCPNNTLDFLAGRGGDAAVYSFRTSAADEPVFFIPAVERNFGLMPLSARLDRLQIASAPRLLIRPG